MPKEAIDILIAAIIAASIAVFAQSTGAKTEILAYTLIFCISYLLVPRAIAYWSNWFELNGPHYLVEVHSESGKPQIAFAAIWPKFWKKKIAVRGCVFELTNNGSGFALKYRGSWKSSQVLFKKYGGNGRELFYFYSGQEDQGKLVPDGLTSIHLDDSGNGLGFYANRLDENAMIQRHAISAFRLGDETLAKLKRASPDIGFAVIGGAPKKSLDALKDAFSNALGDLNEFEAVFGSRLREAVQISLNLSSSPIPSRNMDDREVMLILDELKARIKNCDARFSGFYVASCVVTRDGKKFFGVNLENSSYPAGICAESSAVAAMVSEIGPAVISHVYVYSPNDTPGLTPCGICLQRIADYADDETQIISLSDIAVLAERQLGEILVSQFKLKSERV